MRTGRDGGRVSVPAVTRESRFEDHGVVRSGLPLLAWLAAWTAASSLADAEDAVLPRRRSRLVVKTDDELQVIANRTGESLEYLQLSRADLAGDCATVDVTLHAIVKEPDYPVRCWRTRNVYVKRGGTWQFELTAPQSCP
jgi:hypothetical protein